MKPLVHLILALMTLGLPGALHAEEPLAQPGFMERPGTPCTLFGFTSQVASVEPGIWGALMLTAKQGEEIREVWLETQGRRISEKVSGQEAKDLETQFGQRRAEILTSEQKALVTALNRLAAEVQSEVKSAGDPQAMGSVFRERLASVLSPAQVAAVEAFERQGPQEFPRLFRFGWFFLFRQTRES